MNKIRVLFVCIHNSARSQMAEAFMNQLGGDKFEAHSAGLEPGTLNPIVVEAMQEVGIDISKNQTKGVFDMLKRGEFFGYVFTVCDEASGERCPLFPGAVKKIHWGFPDPSGFKGSHEEKLQETRIIRDMIKAKVADFVKEKSE
jgi:arsenate reductase